METKIVSLKEVKYIAMYKAYYSRPENRAFQLNCFMSKDIIEPKKVKIS